MVRCPERKSERHRNGRSDRRLWLVTTALIGVLCCGGLCVAANVFFLGRYAGPAYVSPDGRYQAQVSGSNCGATCPFTAEVVVTDRNFAWLPWPFPLDIGSFPPDVKETVYDSEYHPCSIVPVWEDDDRLVIAEPLPAGADDPALKRSEGWRDIKIEYGLNRDVESKAEDDDRCYENGARRYVWQAVQGLGTFALVIATLIGSVHLVLRRQPKNR